LKNCSNRATGHSKPGTTFINAARRWNSDTPEYSSVAFAAGGRTLATASHDGTVMLWDLDPLLNLRTHAHDLACAYSGGGLDKNGWARYVSGLRTRRAARPTKPMAYCR
jgi:WD40 repeat protein